MGPQKGASFSCLTITVKTPLSRLVEYAHWHNSSCHVKSTISDHWVQSLSKHPHTYYHNQPSSYHPTQQPNTFDKNQTHGHLHTSTQPHNTHTQQHNIPLSLSAFIVEYNRCRGAHPPQCHAFQSMCRIVLCCDALFFRVSRVEAVPGGVCGTRYRPIFWQIRVYSICRLVSTGVWTRYRRIFW